MCADAAFRWRPVWPQSEPAFAHTPNARGEWHRFDDHARVVGEMAAGFASGFAGDGIARLAGHLHDAGKLTTDVQTALRRRAVDGGARLGAPHKSEGAALAELYLGRDRLIAQSVVGLVVCGHHSQIPRMSAIAALREFEYPELLGTLANRLEDELETPIDELAFAARLPTHLERGVSKDVLRDVELFVRMVHSAVVDADFLDTSAHFSGDMAPRRSGVIGMSRIRDWFMSWYTQRFAGSPVSAVNRLRNGVFAACVEAGRTRQAASVFRLPAPTGSGKTMAAAAFALNHAAQFGKDRVIVAVPLTSITTQNAAEYRDAFAGVGSQVVLEHHSNIIDPEVAEDSWRRLSSENWDAEFIITTTVQLFESIFSARPAAARKLHRIANSVIVLDEIQALPIALLPAILQVLRQLTEHYGVTVLLASATQPAFWRLPAWSAVEKVDILPVDVVPLVAQRVQYDFRSNPVEWDALAEEVAPERQSLVIVNSTTDAQVLHRLLDERVSHSLLHLSTRMCGQHRADVLTEVRRLLAADQPLTLVSTQLVEAGVDLDFPVVLRAIAPAESLVQSGGRCNREGALGVRGGRVVIFDPKNGHLPPGVYRRATQITRDLFGRRGRDLSDPNALSDYYGEVYRAELTGGGRSDDIDDLRCALDFPAVAEKFRMIDDQTTSVIVTDYGTLEERSALGALLGRLRRDPKLMISRSHRQLLQRFSASLPKRWAAESLLVETVGGVSVWDGEYHPSRGVVLDSVGTIW